MLPTNDILTEMESDSAYDSSELDTLGSNQNMRSIAEIAREIRGKQAEIDRLESLLKERKREEKALSEEVLPSMMAEIGLNSFELDDGSKISIKPLYGGYIAKLNREVAYEWLRNNQYDDIIKNVVSVQFGRGEDKKAEECLEILAEKGLASQQDTSVHPQTLKAWVKERIENGDDFPMDLFGAYVSQRAIIKRS